MSLFALRRLIIIASLLGFSSCASLYVGEDLPSVIDSNISKIDKTITMRLVYIGIDPAEEARYYVNGSNSKEIEQYIILQDSFKQLEFTYFPYEYVFVKSEASLIKLLRDTQPDFKTEYFIDVLVTFPKYVHGSGAGMYGVMFSILTLGIFPAYWVSNSKYQIKIYSKDKEYNNFELRESYHEFSSVLFNLVPGSDRKGRLFKLGNIDKNTFKTIFIKIQEVIKNDNSV